MNEHAYTTVYSHWFVVNIFVDISGINVQWFETWMTWQPPSSGWNVSSCRRTYARVCSDQTSVSLVFIAALGGRVCVLDTGAMLR